MGHTELKKRKKQFNIFGDFDECLKFISKNSFQNLRIGNGKWLPFLSLKTSHAIALFLFLSYK